MKMDTLYRKTDRRRKINARLVIIQYYRAGRDEKGYPTAIARTHSPLEYTVHRKVIPALDRKARYVTSIKFKDKQMNVHVSCSCQDYMYRTEFLNAQAGAGEIIYGNGEPPTKVDNPGVRMCKHLIALRDLVKKKHGI